MVTLGSQKLTDLACSIETLRPVHSNKYMWQRWQSPIMQSEKLRLDVGAHLLPAVAHEGPGALIGSIACQLSLCQVSSRLLCPGRLSPVALCCSFCCPALVLLIRPPGCT